MYLSTPRACWQPVLLQPVLLKYYFKSLNTTSITIIMKRLHVWTAVALSHPLVERWDGWCYGRGGRQQMAAPPQGASSHSSDSWRISFLRGPCRSGLNKWHSTVSSPPFFFWKTKSFCTRLCPGKPCERATPRYRGWLLNYYLRHFFLTLFFQLQWQKNKFPWRLRSIFIPDHGRLTGTSIMCHHRHAGQLSG